MRHLTLFFVVALVSAACSGDEAATTTSTTPTTADAPSTVPPTTNALLDQICSDSEALMDDLWHPAFTVSLGLLGSQLLQGELMADPEAEGFETGDDFRVAAERILLLQTDLNPPEFASSATGTQNSAGALMVDDFLTDFADLLLESAESADTGDLDLDKFGVEAEDLVFNADTEIGTQVVGFLASSCP